MSDTPAAPVSGSNLPPVANLTDEMTHHAGLWSHNIAQGGKHEDEIKFRAFQLRLLAEDPDIRSMIGGLLRDANIPQTKRSDLFTQYLHLAFHKVKVRPEKSQISRWAGALQHAWSHDPRPAPEAVAAFIKSEGGDAECARKARGRANRSGSGADTPIPMSGWGSWMGSELLRAEGKSSIPGRMEKGPSGVQFVPSKPINLQSARERFRERLSQMRQLALEANNDTNAANP